MQAKHIDFSIFTGVVVICIITAFTYSGSFEELCYDSHFKNDLTRMITAHFVHYDMVHMLTNLAAYCLLIYLFPASLISQFLALMLSVVTIGIYLSVSGVLVYAGFSGLLYSVPGIEFSKNIKQKKYMKAFFIFATLIIYVCIISMELHAGNFIWEPLKQSHFIGFISGAIVGLKNKAVEESKSPPQLLQIK